MYKFYGNMGKYMKFVEMGEFAICIIDLGWHGRPCMDLLGCANDENDVTKHFNI